MANNKNVKKVNEHIQVMRCVPFQLCPKCGGTGKMVTLNLDTTSYKTEGVCDLCGGSMVIPMAVIEDKK